MSKCVTVVDYGIGNIFSVTRALEHCGATVELTDRPERILAADRIILPGVGAFARGMDGLSERQLVDPLKEYALGGGRLLGICLGMQMLFTRSTEFGCHEGLGIIGGSIGAIAPQDSNGLSLKVPHIGWSHLDRPSACRTWDNTILAGIGSAEYTYFVHSFTAIPDDESTRLADAWYGGVRVSAAVASGRVFGCQFHPEKSGPVGLRILKNFLEC